jgi:hypothetical protein
MENILSMFFKEMRDHFQWWRLLTNMSVQIERFGFVHELAQGKLSGYLEMLEELLEQLGWEDPKSEAKILAALFDGIGIQYYYLKEDYYLDEIEEILLNKYCR